MQQWAQSQQTSQQRSAVIAIQTVNCDEMQTQPMLFDDHDKSKASSVVLMEHCGEHSVMHPTHQALLTK